MAHTPGPWRAFIKNGVVAVMTKAGKEIIHWSGFGASEFSHPTDEANAHLIAAAPELLEACKLVNLMFKRQNASGTFLGDDEHEAWTAAQRAIAKAEGRS